MDDERPAGVASRATMYFPPEPVDAVASDAKHRLADAVRRLIEGVVDVDAAAAGHEALEPLVDAVEAVNARLASLPSLPSAGQRRMSSMHTAEGSLSERSPFVGRSNPVAAPLHLEADGDVVRGWAVYGQAYEGGVGDMHGGVVAAAFDDLLGCAQMVAPIAGRTGTLTVRFRSVSPIGARIDYEGRLDRVEGRKIFCSGSAHAGGTLLAEAEAVFVAPATRPPH